MAAHACEKRGVAERYHVNNYDAFNLRGSFQKRKMESSSSSPLSSPSSSATHSMLSSPSPSSGHDHAAAQRDHPFAVPDAKPPAPEHRASAVEEPAAASFPVRNESFSMQLTLPSITTSAADHTEDFSDPRPSASSCSSYSERRQVVLHGNDCGLIVTDLDFPSYHSP
jgi:hypothetical protein